MRKTISAIALAVVIIAAVPGCKKSKSDNEAFLVVETTPANKSNNLTILGPDFPLKVEITSAMPANGVKIQVTATVDGSNGTPFFTATNNSSAQQNNYTITNTPSGVTCLVTTTVTSLTKSSNTWTGSYRYSKK